MYTNFINDEARKLSKIDYNHEIKRFVMIDSDLSVDGSIVAFLICKDFTSGANFLKKHFANTEHDHFNIVFEILADDPAVLGQLKRISMTDQYVVLDNRDWRSLLITRDERSKPR